jgi:glycosyltransferase involved in cell wall biosynthesis
MNTKPLSISIISSSHEPMDERIYYHFAKTLVSQGHKVSIICSTKLFHSVENNLIIDSFDGSNVPFKNKLIGFRQKLFEQQPDVIISQTPVTNIAAYYFKRTTTKKIKIIYDITEWHPSKNQLKKVENVFSKITLFVSLLTFNLFSSICVNAFIFGETSKKLPYRYLFPFKKSVLISYYPNPIYFKDVRPNHTLNEWVLGYTGVLNEERGFFRFIEAAKNFKQLHPDQKIKLLIIGKFENKQFETDYGNITKSINEIPVTFFSTLPFQDFCAKINEMDLCFDLREKSLENENGLPIKLFYYMASGKPVIYSNLKAIRKDVTDISEFGNLVNPQNTHEIVKAIEKYILNSAYYKLHSTNALDAFKETYNWDKISPTLTAFIQRIYHD